MAELLEKELETYMQNRDHLLATSEGKFVLVHGDKVIGTYDTEGDAIAEGYKQFGNVPFLVRQILTIETPQNFVSGLLAL